MCCSVRIAVCVSLSWILSQPFAETQSSRHVDPVGQLYSKISQLPASEISNLKGKAEAGLPGAQLEFGLACETRYGVLGLSLVDGRMQAVEWFQKAAKQGNAIAERMFAASLVPRHPDEAMIWYERAAQLGDVESSYSLGQMYLDGNISGKSEPDKAAPWFLLAANGGEVQAAFKVGSFYETGYGMQKDEAESAKWYRAAAEQGWKPAQLQLGRLYQSGRGVTQDPQEAAHWFVQAADRLADAAYEYASLITSHRILARSEAEAAQYFRRAADLYRKDALIGNSEAAQKLGPMYESGTGLARSDLEACFWYSVAQEDEDQPSTAVQRTKVRLTPKQADEVKRRVEKWLADSE